jgi:hypothetical protein
MYVHPLTMSLIQISGALALGTDFGSLHNPETHFFIKAIHGSFAFTSMVKSSLIILIISALGGTVDGFYSADSSDSKGAQRNKK